MISLSIDQIAKIVNGKIIACDEVNFVINQLSIDSRVITENALFVAVKGDHFDGHNYVDNALTKGAKIVLVSRTVSNSLPQIVVEDTKLALGQIAKYIREKVNPITLALTGSSGKTTVKEMALAILSNKAKTLATQGNFNNEIGVPLTLLRLTDSDKYAVIELGANHKGEIAYTSKLTQPDIALINNIYEAHLAGFGSIDGVASAKSEIFLGLKPQGVAIINLDNLTQLKQNSSHFKTVLEKHRCYTFSLKDAGADFYASEISFNDKTIFNLHTKQGNIKISLPLLGAHNALNALAASALAISAGASLHEVEQGLNHVKAIKGRLYPIKLNAQTLIIDDTYNANMGSMKAAIDVLAMHKNKKILVVGDMAELGENAPILHQQIGQYAKQKGIDEVISVGQQSALISKAHASGHHFADKTLALQFIKYRLDEKQSITLLFKGSRSAKMDSLIEEIKLIKDKSC